MEKIRIFLASSIELKSDREAIEQYLYRQNKRWKNRGIDFELVHWEDHDDSVSTNGKQKDYNQSLESCDILVVLYWTKMGKYTREEFEVGYARLQAKGKPVIYVYEKTVPFTPVRTDAESLFQFQEHLREIAHFPTKYENAAELNNHFHTQLTDRFDERYPADPPNTRPHALTPLPFLPEVFLGREDDLQAIHDRLFAPQSHLLLLVNGQGGIGKTSIAAQYFHRYRSEYRHVAWVLSERNIAKALLLLATPLGLRFDDNMDTDARLEALLTVMANLSQPCLLVIDNANELSDLEQYYPRLQRCTNFHILFTTRVSAYAAAAFYRIPPLPPDLALEAFHTHYPAFEAAEEPLFREIYTAVDGNTLVLELFAKNLRHFNNRLKKRYLLADLKRDVEQNMLRLSRSAEVDLRYQSPTGLRRAAPEAVIAAMYDLSDLPETESALLSVFAVLPAEAIPFERLETLLGGEDLDTRLLALAQKGWIEYTEQDHSFKCSPVVQEVCRMKNPKLPTDCEALVDALNEKLDYETGIGHLLNTTYEEAAQYARYAEAVLATLKQQPTWSLYVLSERIGSYHRTTGYIGQALLYYEQGVQIKQALIAAEPDNPDFKNGLAISYQNIGITHSAMGNLPQALTFFEDMTKLFEELYDAYPQNVTFKNGLAVSYSQLGGTHSAMGNLPQALTFFEQYNQLEKELYDAYPQNVEFKNGLAISYAKLGDMHSAMGKLPQALTFFEQFNQLEKELYDAYPQNLEFKNGLAISYSKLGETHSAMGNLSQALTFFEKDIELSKELYDAYPQNLAFKNVLAISYERLGSTHTAMGNLPQALTFFEQRSRLGKELYDAYPQNVSFKNGLAISYSQLGVFYRDQKGDAEKARDYFQQCYDLWKALAEAHPEYAEFKSNFEWAERALE